MIRKISLRWLPLWLLCAPAWSQESAPQVLAKSAIEPGSADQLIKVTLGLGLIVATIFLVAWLVKRMGYMQFGGSDQFRVVSSLVVGQRERLIIVEVGQEQIVVGVTPGRVSKLHTLARPIENPVRPQGQPGRSFADRLKQALKGRSVS